MGCSMTVGERSGWAVCHVAGLIPAAILTAVPEPTASALESASISRAEPRASSTPTCGRMAWRSSDTSVARLARDPAAGSSRAWTQCVSYTSGEGAGPVHPGWRHLAISGRAGVRGAAGQMSIPIDDWRPDCLFAVCVRPRETCRAATVRVTSGSKKGDLV